MRKELLTYKDPKSPVSEVFRTLRTNIQFMNTNKKLKTILVTSTFPGEGKSWTASNLAVTFAQAGKRVILIDADMRKGRQYNIFGVLPKPGLSNYLSNMDAENNETSDVNIAKYIQETDVENLHILVAGNVPPNPSELLVSPEMRQLLNELKEMCDLVIIDGTPCDLVTDSIILSRIVDSTIIITAQKETKKDSLTRIVKNIQNVGGKIAGVVVNKVDISSKKFNQSYYYGSISGNSMTRHSKDRKKVDDMFKNLSNYNQNEDEEILNQEQNYFDKNLEKENEDIVSNDNMESKLVYADNLQDSDVNDEGESTATIIDENIKIEENNNNNNNIKQYNPHNKKHKNKQKNKNNYNNNFQNQKNENIKENIENGNQQEQKVNSAEIVEKAESAKNIPDEKANEIINLVNNYIESEKRKQERKS